MPGRLGLRTGTAQEAAVPAECVRVVDQYTFDLGCWSYVTVIAVVTTAFEPRIADDESADLEWVQLGRVTERSLHPNFAKAWPDLRSALV